MDGLQTSLSRTKERVFSGVQPTAAGLHLGNYLGAIKGMLSLQETYEGIYAVVDYHAITVPYDPQRLSQDALEIAMDYLAAGLDPERSTFVVQSWAPEHTELAWALGCITPLSKLEQLPTYKSKRELHRGSVGLGLLAYPVLMAADILLYKATLVPVGEDNAPHVEFTREVVRRFNRLFDPTFPEPQMVRTQAPLVPGLLGQGKMSKSVPGSAIFINDSPDEIRRKLAKAVTDPARVRRSDPGEPTRCSIYALHRIYTPAKRLDELVEGCWTAAIGCLECKQVVAEEIIADLSPFQRRRRELKGDYVHEVLVEGTKRARTIARETMEEVRDKMGLLQMEVR